MKNYLVKATRNFTDGLENVPRTVDDEFVCVKERYEFLLKNNAVELIEIIEEKTEETNEEIAKPKKARKKKSK